MTTGAACFHSISICIIYFSKECIFDSSQVIYILHLKLKHILTTFGIDLSNMHLWTTFEHWYKLSDVGYNSMTTVIWTSCLCCPTSYSRYLEKKNGWTFISTVQPLGKTPVPSWRHPSWTILEQHNKQVKRHWNILDVLSTPKIKTSLFANWTLSKNRFHSTIY